MSLDSHEMRICSRLRHVDSVEEDTRNVTWKPLTHEVGPVVPGALPPLQLASHKPLRTKTSCLQPFFLPIFVRELFFVCLCCQLFIPPVETILICGLLGFRALRAAAQNIQKTLRAGTFLTRWAGGIKMRHHSIIFCS